MAHFVSTNAMVLLNAVDLSAQVTKCSISYTAETQDDTTMGKTSRSRQPGLKDWTMTVEFANDEAAAQVMATMFPVLGTAIAVEYRPVNSARSTTNPGYTGTGIVTDLPFGGSIGDLAVASCTIQGSNGTALARQTA